MGMTKRAIFYPVVVIFQPVPEVFPFKKFFNGAYRCETVTCRYQYPPVNRNVKTQKSCLVGPDCDGPLYLSVQEQIPDDQESVEHDWESRADYSHRSVLREKFR